MAKTVYLDDGTEAEIVTTTERGTHLVRPVIRYSDEYSEYEEVAEQIIEVQRIHDKPPVKKYSDEIERAKADLVALKDEKQEVARVLAETKNDHAELLKRAETDEAVKYVFDFIDGKITHFISKDYRRYRILTLEEALIDDSDYHKDIRLLTLSGKQGHQGIITWEMNRYRDGSGSNSRVWPFRSYDEAFAELQRILTVEADEVVTKYQQYQAEQIAESAKACGIKLSSEFMALHLDQKMKAKQQRVEKMRADLAKVEAEEIK